MAELYRRTAAWGPLDLGALNLTQSRVERIWGERVVPGPVGTYVSWTGDGFSYRRNSGATSEAPGVTPRSPGFVHTPDDGDIKTASVAQLQELSPLEHLAELQAKLPRVSVLALVAFSLVPLTWFSWGTLQTSSAFCGGFVILSLVGLLCAHVIDSIGQSISFMILTAKSCCSGTSKRARLATPSGEPRASGTSQLQARHPTTSTTREPRI